MLITAFYISTITGKSRYLLAGPYRTRQEAIRRLPEFAGVDLSEIPAEFIEPLNYNYPSRFDTVQEKASRAELPVSWLGSSIENIDVKNLF